MAMDWEKTRVRLRNHPSQFNAISSLLYPLFTHIAAPYALTANIRHLC